MLKQYNQDKPQKKSRRRKNGVRGNKNIICLKKNRLFIRGYHLIVINQRSPTCGPQGLHPTIKIFSSPFDIECEQAYIQPTNPP